MAHLKHNVILNNISILLHLKLPSFETYTQCHCHSLRSNCWQTGIRRKHATVHNSATSSLWGLCI